MAQTGLLTNRQFYQLLTAASVGCMFEFYDFFLAAAAAATVWPTIFFPKNIDPALALAVAVASVGFSYLARPVGAITFGHYGDRYGRKTSLVGTMILMGIATLGTALLPPYASIGILAVALLFVFRFLMGMGVGGESGGAFSWIAEATPNSKHRGFWVTWPNIMTTIGKLLSVFAFFIAASWLSRTAYMDWGWRVCFLVGAVVVAVGLIIRIKVNESPMFQQLQAKRSVLKYPSLQVIKEQWRKIFTMLWLNTSVTAASAFVILPYSVSYLVKLGTGDAFANLAVSAGAGISSIAMLAAGFASDYMGRLKILRIGALLTMAMIFPFFWLLQTLNPLLIIIAQILLYSLSVIPDGVCKAIYTENFPTKYRQSGAGLSHQLSTFCTGLLIAMVLPLLLVNYGIVGAWQPIALVGMAMCAITVVASLFMKETRGITLES